MEINTDSKLSSQHKISVLHMINSVPGEIDARGPTLDEKNGFTNVCERCKYVVNLEL